MNDWKEYKLGDVCTELSDGLHKAPIFTIGGDYIFVNAKNISNGFIIDNDPSKKSSYDEYLKYSSPLDETTILYSIDGTIGNIALYRGEKCILGKGACYINPNPQIVERMYLYYELQSPQFKAYIDKMSTGSTIKHISLKTMRNYLFYCPSLIEQKRIASILKSLDDKIECNRRINANLEAQAQALFKSWFVDFEPFQSGEFVDSELGPIPKGWRVTSLDNLCSFISRGLTPKYDDSSDELILGQTCVRNNIVTLNNARKHRPKIKNDKWVQKWDILINSTGIGSLGRVGIVYFDLDNVAIDSHITVVRAKKPLFFHYLGRNLLYRQLEIENMAVGSTGQTELPRERVKSLTILLPDDNTLEKFNDLIESIAIKMYHGLEESRRLAELRDALLPRLMSGELKVDDVKL